MRAIDGDRLLRELTALSHGQVWPGWTYEGIRLLIERQPTLTPPNEPLTLDELREMNEEPVWVQNMEEPEKSRWRLLYWDRGKYLVLQGISVRGYLLEEYGKSWLAYRRPPEGEEDT